MIADRVPEGARTKLRRLRRGGAGNPASGGLVFLYVLMSATPGRRKRAPASHKTRQRAESVDGGPRVAVSPEAAVEGNGDILAAILLPLPLGSIQI